MLGETVTVWRREQAGSDSMGEPVWSWVSEDVEGCLVRPRTGSDANDSMRPDGVNVSAVVAFPKTYDKRDNLANCKVAFRGMGLSDALHVSGYPIPTSPCPTSWDTLAEVGRADG